MIYTNVPIKQHHSLLPQSLTPLSKMQQAPSSGGATNNGGDGFAPATSGGNNNDLNALIANALQNPQLDPSAKQTLLQTLAMNNIHMNNNMSAPAPANVVMTAASAPGTMAPAPMMTTSSMAIQVQDNGNGCGGTIMGIQQQPQPPAPGPASNNNLDYVQHQQVQQVNPLMSIPVTPSLNLNDFMSNNNNRNNISINMNSIHNHTMSNNNSNHYHQGNYQIPQVTPQLTSDNTTGMNGNCMEQGNINHHDGGTSSSNHMMAVCNPPPFGDFEPSDFRTSTDDGGLIQANNTTSNCSPSHSNNESVQDQPSNNGCYDLLLNNSFMMNDTSNQTDANHTAIMNVASNGNGMMMAGMMVQAPFDLQLDELPSDPLVNQYQAESGSMSMNQQVQQLQQSQQAQQLQQSPQSQPQLQQSQQQQQPGNEHQQRMQEHLRQVTQRQMEQFQLQQLRQQQLRAQEQLKLQLVQEQMQHQHHEQSSVQSIISSAQSMQSDLQALQASLGNIAKNAGGAKSQVQQQRQQQQGGQIPQQQQQHVPLKPNKIKQQQYEQQPQQGEEGFMTKKRTVRSTSRSSHNPRADNSSNWDEKVPQAKRRRSSSFSASAPANKSNNGGFHYVKVVGGGIKRPATHSLLGSSASKMQGQHPGVVHTLNKNGGRSSCLDNGIRAKQQQQPIKQSPQVPSSGSSIPTSSSPPSTASKKPNSLQDYLDSLLTSRGYQPSKRLASQLGYRRPPTPLQLASFGFAVCSTIRKGGADRLTALLGSGLSPNPTNKFGDSPFFMACKRGLYPLVKVFVDAGAEVCVADGFGRTPLHYVAWANPPCMESAELFLRADARLLYVSDAHGKTPLDFVGEQHRLRWVEFLEGIKDEVWPVVCNKDNNGGRAYFPEGRQDDDEDDHGNSSSSGIPDPKDALSVELAEKVASGHIMPEEARKQQQQLFAMQQEQLEGVVHQQ